MNAPGRTELLLRGERPCAGFALANLELGSRAVPGLVTGSKVFDLHLAAEAAGVELVPDVPRPDLLDLLRDWDRSLDRLAGIAEFAESAGHDERFSIGPQARVLPPISRPSKMIYAAQNYPDHVREMRDARKFGFNDADTDPATDFTGDRDGTWPYVFLKAPSCLAGAYDDIRIPPEVTKLDWEVELAVVIGRRATRISAARALDHVAGFMTTNDLSARNLLFRPDRDRLRSDWFSGKSHDGFAPMGPLFVPAMFVPNHLDLPLTLSVNGEVKQFGNTRHLIFSPAEQIEFASRMTTLEPGDILATGTPGGVGQGTDSFLQSGDVVQAEVEGLGVLRNHVVG